ncbi:MAG: hypothetical protein KC777_08665 [Cyanobacteria bacterium HKST-UBA02]|nr:hypothetical protein [Cyanobacteria bacterium HKST-UBA02]
MFTVSCLAAAAAGATLGYVFSWSVRTQKPSMTELSSLIATILGGSAISTITRLNCPESLTYYILGVAAGFFIYLLMAIFNWNYFPRNAIGQTVPPLFPFHHVSRCGQGAKADTERSTRKQ